MTAADGEECVELKWALADPDHAGSEARSATLVEWYLDHGLQ